MDAMEFGKQLDRICKSHSCESCPLGGGKCSIRYIGRNGESVVKIVEEWAKDHPVKTRQSEFLKIFPKAIVSDGAIALCPQFYCVTLLGTDFTGCKTANCANCAKCRREYWLTEVTNND